MLQCFSLIWDFAKILGHSPHECQECILFYLFTWQFTSYKYFPMVLLNPHKDHVEWPHNIPSSCCMIIYQTIVLSLHIQFVLSFALLMLQWQTLSLFLKYFLWINYYIVFQKIYVNLQYDHQSVTESKPILLTTQQANSREVSCWGKEQRLHLESQQT